MKKVKLAKIATAIMVAGVVSAPASALANEAQVAQAAAEKTEVVAETAAAAEVTEEAPAAEETPAVTEEVVTPVAPVEEVTPEAPAVAETTKPEVVAPKTEEATAPKAADKKVTKVASAEEELTEAKRVAYVHIAELKVADRIDEDYWNTLGEEIRVASTVEEVEAITSTIVLDGHKKDLDQVKGDAYNNIAELKLAGTISEAYYNELAEQIRVADTIDEVNSIVAGIDLSGEKDELALQEAKGEAYTAIAILKVDGYISVAYYDELVEQIVAATTVEEVEAVVENLVPDIDYEAALVEAKSEAYKTLAELKHDGSITEDYYNELVDQLIEATTIRQVEDIIAGIVYDDAAAELAAAKEEAIAALDALLEADDISDEYYAELVAWVSIAESVEEIDFILDGIVIGEHKSELDKAKIAAYATLEELLVNDDISVDYYNELVAWVSVAASVEEIDFILDNIEIGAHKSELEKAKTEAFETIGELLANDDISIEYYGELAEWISAAESVEEVDFIIAGIVVGEHKSELDKAKVAAFETIGQLLANDDISVEYYGELAEWISAAESVEEIDFILENIVIGEHKSELDKAKAEAFITIGKLLADDDISVEYYGELATAISAAESVEEVDAILAGIVVNEHKSELEKAKIEAFEIIGELLANGYIDVPYYSELARAISAATTVEEVEAVLNGIVINELVLDTTDLEALIAEGKTYNKAWFTPGSWSVFAVALNDAEEFLASTQNRTLHLITQAEVNAQVAALEAAINQLEELPHGVLNLDELLATIKTGKALKQADYTVASWSVFAAALDHAELFVSSTYARFDAITQADVDAETAALKAAIAQLVLVKAVDPAPVKPIIVTPVVVKPTKKDDKKVVVTKEAELPQTGEKENALLAVYGLTMAALAGLFVSKRKKEENI